MAGGIEDVHAREHASERRCPFCRDVLSERSSAWECPGCQTRLHAACARELRVCPTLGCGAVIEGYGPLPLPVRLGQGETVLVERPHADERAPPRRDSVRERARGVLAGVGSLLLVLALLAIGMLAFAHEMAPPGKPASSDEVAATVSRVAAALLIVLGVLPALLVEVLALIELVTGKPSRLLDRILGGRPPASGAK